MRPLFDALYDTMDPEKLNAFIERERSRSRRWPLCAEEL